MTDTLRLSFETKRNYWQKRHRIDSAGRDYVFYAKIPKIGSNPGLLRFTKRRNFLRAKKNAIPDTFEIADRRFIYDERDKSGKETRFRHIDAVDTFYKDHLNISVMLFELWEGKHDIPQPFVENFIERILDIFENDLHERRQKQKPEQYFEISWYIIYDLFGKNQEGKEFHDPNRYRPTNIYDITGKTPELWRDEMRNVLQAMFQFYDDYKNVILKEIGVNFRKPQT